MESLHLWLRLAGRRIASVAAHANGSQKSSSKRRVLVLRQQEIPLENIRHDLAPKGASRAASDDSKAFDFHIELLHCRDTVAQREGNPFHDRARKVCERMSAVDTHERASQIRVPVWSAFAIQIGMKNEAFAASRSTRSKNRQIIE